MRLERSVERSRLETEYIIRAYGFALPEQPSRLPAQSDQSQPQPSGLKGETSSARKQGA
jgi:hypothetical protein